MVHSKKKVSLSKTHSFENRSVKYEFYWMIFNELYHISSSKRPQRFLDFEALRCSAQGGVYFKGRKISHTGV